MSLGWPGLHYITPGLKSSPTPALVGPVLSGEEQLMHRGLRALALGVSFFDLEDEVAQTGSAMLA